MVNGKIYAPIIKWKSGEIAALSLLHDDRKKSIIPIIEIVDDITPTEIISGINNSFPASPVYVDMHYVDDEDGFMMMSLLKEALINKINHISPVLYAVDFPEIADKIYENKLSSRYLLRIPVPEDFDGPTHEDIFQIIKDWKSDKDVEIDVVLDMYYIDNKNNANTKLSELKSVLRNYISIKETVVRNVIIASTSFPESLSSLAAGENILIDRIELKLFEKIYKSKEFEDIKDKMIFSDYGVTRFTDSEIDFSRLKYGVLPKARYTIQDKYWVLKGKKDPITKQYTRSQTDLAREIYYSDKYYGENFSFGDLDIKERALNHRGPGNSGNWVTITANHHLTVVTEELSNLSYS